jgi:hypothetical protein
MRSIILVNVYEVGTSCGWSVPIMEYKGDRSKYLDVVRPPRRASACGRACICMRACACVCVVGHGYHSTSKLNFCLSVRLRSCLFISATASRRAAGARIGPWSTRVRRM